MHFYEVRPRKDKRGFDLISDALPFGRLWYVDPNAISNAVGYAKFLSRSHDAVIRVFDEARNVIEAHEHKGELKDWLARSGRVIGSFIVMLLEASGAAPRRGFKISAQP